MKDQGKPRSIRGWLTRSVRGSWKDGDELIVLESAAMGGTDEILETWEELPAPGDTEAWASEILSRVEGIAADTRRRCEARIVHRRGETVRGTFKIVRNTTASASINEATEAATPADYFATMIRHVESNHRITWTVMESLLNRQAAMTDTVMEENRWWRERHEEMLAREREQALARMADNPPSEGAERVLRRLAEPGMLEKGLGLLESFTGGGEKKNGKSTPKLPAATEQASAPKPPVILGVDD